MTPAHRLLQVAQHLKGDSNCALAFGKVITEGQVKAFLGASATRDNVRQFMADIERPSPEGQRLLDFISR